VNGDQRSAHGITLPVDAERDTLKAKRLQDSTVQHNEKTLRLKSRGEVQQLTGEPTRAKRVCSPPGSITFMAIADAATAVAVSRVGPKFKEQKDD